jgi:hypothetical protein
MTLNLDASARDSINVLFNGPAIAGVGATTDAGLARDKYHVLPYDPKEKTEMSIRDGSNGVTVSPIEDHNFIGVRSRIAFQCARYNVDTIFGFDEYMDKYPAVPKNIRDNLRLDMIAIIFLSTAYNYYDEECTQASAAQMIAMRQLNEELATDVITKDRINRAATFILARMHTKYQTNHVVGGNPMQASMLSAARAYYEVSSASNVEARSRMNAVAGALHWVTHPLNERLLIPCVIKNSHITKAFVPSSGPTPQILQVEEYFHIRANTPPASTHHFYVCASAARHLEPLGILPYLPRPTRVNDVRTGFTMIRAYGAALHPSARHWGFVKVSANQKLVESLCADLGYAVRKLTGASSLAASPILQKEDALDSGWKTFIDSVRAAMDERGQDLVDDSVLQEIKLRIAPSADNSIDFESIARLVEGDGGITAAEVEARRAARAAESAHPSDDEEEPDYSTRPESRASVAAPETEKGGRATATGTSGPSGQGATSSAPGLPRVSTRAPARDGDNDGA